MINLYLLTGSNLGNRKMFLNKAIDMIASRIAPISAASSVYETQSWGKSDAPDYLNQVLMLQTDMSARKVLETVLDIEKQLGRVRKEKWGSRVIDIDILFFGDEVIQEPDLQVPHPHLQNRRFTLEPLVEIAPNLLHPVLRTTLQQLKTELRDDLIVKKI